MTPQSFLDATLGALRSVPPELVLAGLAGLMVGAIGGSLLTGFLLLRANGRLGDRFEALSAEALDRSNERFLTLAGERLGALERSSVESLAQREAAVDALVRPLRESLHRVDEKLQKVETEREGHYRSLTKHLELVALSHRDLERETRSLGQALRNPNSGGRWGELQLRRVVELAGMLEHCDFQEQVSVPKEGGRARPDLVVQLPGGRQIAIDSKAPLQAYLAATEAVDEAEQVRLLGEHARNVRRHLDELGTRAYWSKLEGSPEFVVLYLPGEPFFSAAVAQDPQLIERGVDRKVLLAGPTTLIALLRAVAYGWQQEEMARNARSVAKLGRELFDRIVTLNDRFGTLGRRLDSAVDAYNAALGSFESRVQVSARRMAELGVAQGQELREIQSVDRRARPPQTLEDDGAAPLPTAEHGPVRDPADSSPEQTGSASSASPSGPMIG